MAVSRHRRLRALAGAVPLAALHLPCAMAMAAEAGPAPQMVVVTAARHPMPAADAPAAMSVVTREDVRARAADNVLEAIRGDVGLSLQGRAVGGRQVLGIRGLDSKHTLFLVDGRRIGASDGTVGASDFQYDWIAAEDIERIEIVRGPLSVLYGSEALGGVVNIMTREPGTQWRLGAALEGSQADGDRGGDGHRASARVDGPLGMGLGLRAGAAQTRRASLTSPTDGRVSELEAREKEDGWAALVWQPAAGQRLDLEWREGRERRWGLARERGGQRRHHETINHVDRRLASAGWEARWRDAAGFTGLSSQLRAYATRLSVVNLRTAGVAANLPQTLDEDVVEGQLRGQRGTHDLTTGFEARDETLHDPGLPGGASSVRHRAAYLQDEWAAHRGLTITSGLRHDRHGLFGSHWSPRVYGVWRPATAWTIKGGYSAGFKAPNLKQIVPGTRREGPNDFIGNPALTPEVSRSVEVGAAWQAGGRGGQVMAFDQRVDDLIDIRLVQAGSAPGTGTYTYENLARARMRGLEAGYVGPLDAMLRLQLSYTYLDASSGSGQRLDRRPRHTGAVRLDAHHGPWRGGLNVEVHADQRLPSPNVGQASVAVPSVALWGAHLARPLPGGLEATLAVTNLTQVRLADRSPLFTQVEWPRTWRLALRGQW